MYRVAVLEPASGQLTARLGNFFLAEDRGFVPVITKGAAFGDFCGMYDLFVVTASDVSGTPPPDLHCRALLVSGDGQAKAALHIPSQWVVSFGLSGKDSITVSSLEPDCAVIALLRELVTLNGLVLEQQELPLPIPWAAEAAELMVFYGSLLLLGVPPEDLAV